MNFLIIDSNRQVVAIESVRPEPGVYPPPLQVIPNFSGIPVSLPRTLITEDGIEVIPGTILSDWSLDEQKTLKKLKIADVLATRLKEPLEKYSEGQRQGWSYDVDCAQSYQKQKTFESAGKLLIRVMSQAGFPPEMLTGIDTAIAEILPEDKPIIHDGLNDLTLRIISKSEMLYSFRAIVEGHADSLNAAVDAARTIEELDTIDPETIPQFSAIAGI